MRDRGMICLCAGSNGSTGDVRPLIALALALRARGYQIVLLGDAAFERTALRAGITATEWFSSSDVPQSFWLRTRAGQCGLWGRRPTFADRWIRRELAQHWRQQVARFWRRVGGPDNPRIVAAVGSITGVRMLLRFGPQCARIVSCPMPYQPSVDFTLAPPDLSRRERLRARLQQAWMDRRAVYRNGRREFCEELFHLVSASPTIFPRPADWLPNMQVTGYTPLEDDALGWSPPAPLREFLERGGPPLFFGVGGHAVLFGPEGERRTRAIIEGCRRRQLRCIIQSPDVPRSLASDQVFVLDGDVSHAWLFPRCAAIAHHGGYGTLHAALMAQRPMIIYPFQTDQFLWATRLGELGVGPGFTARLRDLTADRLACDLDVVLTPACEARAAEVGTAVMDDRGLAVHLAAIDSMIEHTRLGRRPVDWQMPATARSEARAPVADPRLVSVG
jgi:UDP:flavonoid glycosyltransferase YjiC (YdhE family)